MDEGRWPDQRRFVTSVGRVDQAEVVLRGYRLSDIIRNVSYPEAFFLLVKGELPTKGEARVLDAVLCAVLDYALFKPGTVAARIVVSANPSMQAGLATAMVAAGQHTLDPSETGKFIYDAYDAFKASGESDVDVFAASYLPEYTSNGRRVPGLGHPVFEYVDPRAQMLRDIADDAGVLTERIEVYEAVHRAFTAQPRREKIPINDVGMMACVLAELGLTPAEMTGVALASTMPGLIAHISEEMTQGVRIRVVDEANQRYNGYDIREMHTERS